MLFLFSEHPDHGGAVGYGEIPKSCTMENRHNTDLMQQHQQQLYATIQRKQPPVPPFSQSKGFDTIDR